MVGRHPADEIEVGNRERSTTGASPAQQDDRLPTQSLIWISWSFGVLIGFAGDVMLYSPIMFCTIDSFLTSQPMKDTNSPP